MKIRIMKLIYCCIKNEGHSNRKKEKSFPFQSNLGVQKYSIIKKIAHSRNSLQTYNKKKERNKIMKLQILLFNNFNHDILSFYLIIKTLL